MWLAFGIYSTPVYGKKNLNAKNHILCGRDRYELAVPFDQLGISAADWVKYAKRYCQAFERVPEFKPDFKDAQKPEKGDEVLHLHA